MKTICGTENIDFLEKKQVTFNRAKNNVVFQRKSYQWASKQQAKK